MVVVVALVNGLTLGDFDLARFFVGTAFGMLRGWFHFDSRDVATIGRSCDLLLLELFLGVRFLLLLQKVALAPVLPLRVVNFGLLLWLCLLCVNLLSLLFGQVGLGISNLLVLLFGAVV